MSDIYWEVNKLERKNWKQTRILNWWPINELRNRHWRQYWTDGHIKASYCPKFTFIVVPNLGCQIIVKILTFIYITCNAVIACYIQTWHSDIGNTIFNIWSLGNKNNLKSNLLLSLWRVRSPFRIKDVA